MQLDGGMAALSSQLTEVQTRAAPAWLLTLQAAWLQKIPPSPIARLLPRYDAYLLGYRNRDPAIDPAYVKRIYPGADCCTRRFS